MRYRCFFPTLLFIRRKNHGERTVQGLIWNTIKACHDYIYWVDKYFSTEGLQLLVTSVDKNKIKTINILTSLARVECCELRVIVDNQLNASIHDRSIISKNNWDIHFKPYTEEEFFEIAVNVLDREEGVDRDIALLIADAVYNRLKSSNIRECVRIARLAKNDSAQIKRIIDTFTKYGNGKCSQIN